MTPTPIQCINRLVLFSLSFCCVLFDLLRAWLKQDFCACLSSQRMLEAITDKEEEYKNLLLMLNHRVCGSPLSSSLRPPRRLPQRPPSAFAVRTSPECFRATSLGLLHKRSRSRTPTPSGAISDHSAAEDRGWDDELLEGPMDVLVPSQYRAKACPPPKPKSPSRL